MLALLALLGVGLLPGPAQPQLVADSCLRYEPAAVRLEGTLFYELDYGAPGFGESPAIDEKGYFPMIRLAQPISVCGDPSSEVDRDTERNVREIQLVFVDRRVPPRRNGNRHIVVTGTLFHGFTGHHYRPVLITVGTFRFAGGRPPVKSGAARRSAPGRLQATPPTTLEACLDRPHEGYATPALKRRLRLCARLVASGQPDPASGLEVAGSPDPRAAGN